jgi:hypothetical protein
MLPDAPRQPLRATLTRTPGERRLNRIELGACSACGQEEVRVMLRTDYVLYLRCEQCRTMRVLPKPGQELFGT